jgi:hypothetical protein
VEADSPATAVLRPLARLAHVAPRRGSLPEGIAYEKAQSDDHRQSP